MTYIIAEPCIGVKDLACVEVCPSTVSTPPMVKGEDMLYIDPDECIDCAHASPSVRSRRSSKSQRSPEYWAQYYDINVNFFQED